MDMEQAVNGSNVRHNRPAVWRRWRNGQPELSYSILALAIHLVSHEAQHLIMDLTHARAI